MTSIQVLISPETIRTALEDTLERLFKVEKLDALALARRPLGEKATAIQRVIVRDAINVHLLTDIVRYALDDVAEHASAIDKVGDGRAALLHVRHIEELYTIIKYLVSKPEKYEEFQWRWQVFPNIHALKNKIMNLKSPLEPVLQAWVDENVNRIAEVYQVKVTNDCYASQKHWEKISNWLHPIYLKEIFEKTDRKESYHSAEYDWNSQAVHFSPLSETYLGFQLEHMTYSEFAIGSTCRYINGFCKVCLPLVANTDALRQYHAKMVLLEMYRMLREKPQQYIDLANRLGVTGNFTEIILNNPSDIGVVINAAIGEPPEDPLVIKVR